MVVPAFAVGRAQSDPRSVAAAPTRRVEQRPRCTWTAPWRAVRPNCCTGTKSEHKLAEHEFEQACAAVTRARSRRVQGASANRYPKVILSASGMATGGRVLHHIAAFAPDHRNTLLPASSRRAPADAS